MSDEPGPVGKAIGCGCFVALLALMVVWFGALVEVGGAIARQVLG